LENMATLNLFAQKRLFHNMFVCMKCGTKQRSDPAAIKAKRVKCRRCGYDGLRPKKRMIKAKA